MANAIPKWVQERLSKIWKEYNGKEMTYEMIEKILSLDDKNTISVFLNELKKSGWIKVKLDQNDARKRVYLIKQPNEVMMEIISDDDKRSKG